MQRDGKDTELSILDYLNEDCLNAVLDYVPVKDIICSERVSRQWQRMVLVYLQHIKIGIKHPTCPKLFSSFVNSTVYSPETIEALKTYENRNLRWMTVFIYDWLSFELWSRKLGTSVVATYCTTVYSLDILKKNCPNMEAVMFSAIHRSAIQHPYRAISADNSDIFKQLQWLHFSGCTCVTDSFVSPFICSKALEVIDISEDENITGQCFTNIKSTKLKTLMLNKLYSLDFRYLLLAADNFSSLTKLVLRNVSREIYSEIHLVLAKIHNLEHLDMYDTGCVGLRYMEFSESVSELSRLKHLGGNFMDTDFGLEAVTRSCRGLKSVELENCYGITGRGLAAMCSNVGRQLLALRIKKNLNVSDDDVVACIRSCPKLSLLNLDGCRQLTNDLLPRVAATRRALRPRPPALRISIDNIALDLRANVENMGIYEGLILDF